MNAEMPDSLARHRCVDRDFGSVVKLLPNEYYVTTGPKVLLTVLGSCVAACLIDPYAAVAGMNHFMLPDAGQGGLDQPAAMRYGAHSMDVLVRALVRAGARRERLQAKVFGGAAVLPNMPLLNVGDRNAQFVLRYLQAEKIGLYAQDLGGSYARRVAFLADSGKVVVRKLRTAQDLAPVQLQESEMLRALTPARVAGDAP